MSQSSWRFSPSPAKGEIAMPGAIVAVLPAVRSTNRARDGGGRQSMTGYSVQERDVAVARDPDDTVSVSVTIDESAGADQ